MSSIPLVGLSLLVSSALNWRWPKASYPREATDGSAELHQPSLSEIGHVASVDRLVCSGRIAYITQLAEISIRTPLTTNT